MKQSIILISVLITALTSCAQDKQHDSQKPKQQVGGACEGCEAIYESPKPLKELGHEITLPDYNESGPKLEVSGIVYKADGKTPAKDVVIYIYHTDQKGLYATKGNESSWGKRHGYIRGWMKTNNRGEYRFHTLRPASYPNSTNPQHIHVIIKEPDKNEYWIDEFEFADDPLLPAEKTDRKPVGGNGILKVENRNGVQVAVRHIFLGQNVQNYSK